MQNKIQNTDGPKAELESVDNELVSLRESLAKSRNEEFNAEMKYLSAVFRSNSFQRSPVGFPDVCLSDRIQALKEMLAAEKVWQNAILCNKKVEGEFSQKTLRKKQIEKELGINPLAFP